MRKTFSLPVAATAAGGGVTPPPADTVDNIEHSVRFNSADSAYLSRTPSSAGNRKTWTWSGWVKRSSLGRRNLFNAYDGSNLTAAGYTNLLFDTDDKLAFYSGGYKTTAQVFRDLSAWYHIVIAVDTTQATANDRVKIYVNGEQVTDFSNNNNPSQNADLAVNETFNHRLGSEVNQFYLDGYLANIELIDGLQLTPSSFGFTDSNGVWQPKAYTGSYGTNGFHLDFADTSSATALGNDVSGNNNDWTPNGLVAGPAYTANSWSTEFDGNGDYLSIPDDPSLDLGTDDYTVEAWIYPAATSGIKEILTKGFGFQLYQTGGNLAIAVSSVGSSTYDINSNFGTVAVNQWYHVAVTRSGNTTRAFLNGTLGLTSTASTTIHNNTDAFGIGDYVPLPNYSFNGKISNVRVIKGRALYTAAFTPPSTALTAVTDTVLLTCQDSTFIDNSASAHTITANGDAATTTVSPFEPVDGSDAMLDSPTNYGSGDTVRGNYCTLNPLDTDSNITLSDGNLKATGGGNWYSSRATFGMSSGKWYWEAAANTTNDFMVGITKSDAALSSYLGAAASGWAYFLNGGTKWNNGSSSSYGATCAVNDTVGIAFDADNGTLVFYKNGVSQGTAFTGLTSGPYFPTISTYGNVNTVNFGQQPFKYPLDGYKSLCSTNLPTPAIADGSTAMDVALYTGTGTAQSISTPNLSPDLVWLKIRNTAGSHGLWDSVRGTSSRLVSNSTNAEDTTVGVTALSSNGFTVDGPYNTASNNWAAWTWDAGSSTVSNTDGTITSQVRANPSAGFSIVTAGANGYFGGSVGHGLGVSPEFILAKDRNSTYGWRVYHKSTGNNFYFDLTTGPATNYNSNLWNVTSSVFGSYAGVSGSTLVAYCFASVEGFSSFGSYTGSTSGTFVYTGMRPRWLMIKRTDTTGNWQILDTEREGYNVDNDPLWANLSTAEGTTDIADILSNGFKMRDGATGDYIYAAFAEHPFKTSRAR